MKRYNLTLSEFSGEQHVSAFEAEDGDWVRYEDHEQELMAAYAEIRELHARLRDLELGLL